MEKADIEKAAQVVAQSLNETEDYAIRKIRRMIEHLGIDFVQTAVEEAQRIEADGGLMIADSKRRRTLGGVFFFTAKSKLTPEQKALIFPKIDWKKRKAAKKRKKLAEKALETDNKKGA